jgi:putative FmdB family regulatory protein
MPFYEYECSACGQHAEVLRKVSDPPLRKCPNCGKSALKRLISAPVFRLKGSGWYETDFKTDKDNKRNLAGGDDSGDSGGTDATAVVTKPDAKADSKDASASAPESKPAEKAEKPAKPEPKSASPSASKSASKPSAKAKAKPAAKKKSSRR